jgi:hypothetical protein
VDEVCPDKTKKCLKGITMTNPVETLMIGLEAMMSEFDATVLVDSQAWATGRMAAVAAWEAENPEWHRRSPWETYPKLHAIAGGKTWYGVFVNGAKYTEQFVIKNCAAVVKSRNAKIAVKLTKAGITEIKNAEVVRREDGFNGVYSVGTTAGEKQITIKTILAGGHNIQCLHHRVLVNVK